MFLSFYGLIDPAVITFNLEGNLLFDVIIKGEIGEIFTTIMVITSRLKEGMSTV